MIERPEQLAALPAGFVIRDHGLLAIKTADGWLYGDGCLGDPDLPVEAIGLPAT